LLTAAFDRAHDHSDAAISITRGDTPSCGESRHTSARASAAVSIIVGDPGTRARPDWIGIAFSALESRDEFFLAFNSLGENHEQRAS
jgi:hypothetical protein